MPQLPRPQGLADRAVARVTWELPAGPALTRVTTLATCESPPSPHHMCPPACGLQQGHRPSPSLVEVSGRWWLTQEHAGPASRRRRALALPSCLLLGLSSAVCSTGAHLRPQGGPGRTETHLRRPRGCPAPAQLCLCQRRGLGSGSIPRCPHSRDGQQQLGPSGLLAHPQLTMATSSPTQMRGPGSSWVWSDRHSPGILGRAALSGQILTPREPGPLLTQEPRVDKQLPSPQPPSHSVPGTGSALHSPGE